MPTAKSPDSAARLVVAKIGAGAPEIVSEEVRHFYEWLTEEIAGVRCSLGDFVPCFTVDDLDQRPDLPARLLKQAAVEADGDHNLTIFVHLQAAAGITVPSNCENFLLHTIRELAITTTSTDRLFILLREELPPEGDVFRRILQDVAHSGQVVILDKTGSSWPPSEAPPRNLPDPAEFRLRLKQSSPGLLSRIERRTRRIRGHFRREIPGSGLVCTRYFYDASRCTGEVALFILDCLERAHIDFRCVLFDADVSTWLKDVAALLANEAGVGLQDVRRYLAEDDAIPEVDIGDSLLLLPLVDTSTTLHLVLEGIRMTSGALPRAVAAVFVNAPSETDGNNDELHVEPRQISLPSGLVDIPFLHVLKVRRGLEASRGCALCQEELMPPQPFPSGVTGAQIPALLFWEIVRDAGFKKIEENVPRWRGALPGVPNFAAMLAGEDGVWLASLAAARLEASVLGDGGASVLLLIAPDQPGARVVARRIEDISPGCQAVFVPDDVVKRFQVDPLAEFSAGDYKADWYRRLSGSSKLSKPVICEEFCVSGKTAEAIRRLLCSLGRPPVAHLVIADFQGSTGEEGGVRRVSIYGFPVDEGIGRQLSDLDGPGQLVAPVFWSYS